MSNLQNVVWLENAYDNFQEAVEMGDYNAADAVIKDVADKGFTKESVQMATELAKEIMQEKIEDVTNDLV